MKTTFQSLLIGLSLMMIAAQSTAADFEFRTIEGHGGLPINVAVGGNPTGPEILFIHGMAMSYLSFEPQFKSELADDFKIVAYDLRGHGNSGKPWRREDVQDSDIWADDLAAVIKATDLERPVIVGWSFGGFVAADYIRKYGIDKMAGLNLVGSIAGLVPQPPPAGNFSADELARRSAFQTGGNIINNLSIVESTVKLFEFEGMTPEYKANMYAMGVMVPAYFRKAFVGRNLDHQDVLPKLNLPLLITMGSKDIAQSPEPYARLKKALPNAQYSEFEGVGHLPFAQDPARYNRELAAFVKKANRERGANEGQ